MGRTEQGLREEKWQICWCCRDQHKTCRMAQISAQILEQTGPVEPERVATAPQSGQLSRTPEPFLSKRRATFAHIEKVLVLQSNQSSLSGLCTNRDREGGGPNGQIVSRKRTAAGGRQSRKIIIDEKREKHRAKYRSLWNTSTDSKVTTFVILKNHSRTPI